MDFLKMSEAKTILDHVGNQRNIVSAHTLYVFSTKRLNLQNTFITEVYHIRLFSQEKYQPVSTPCVWQYRGGYGDQLLAGV